MRTRYLLLSTVLSWGLLWGCGDGVSGIGYKRQNNVIAPTCGDGTVNSGEVCDDGNREDGDGCSADCLSTEVCGNGITDPGEECDGESYCESCVDTRITEADEEQDPISDFHEGRA
jgi:cysteine-rich repeat protein